MLVWLERGTLLILVVCSILVLGVILERMLAWMKTSAQSRGFRNSLKRVMESGDEEEIKSACDRSKAPLASVLSYVWEAEHKLRPEQTQILLVCGLDQVSTRLKRFLALLATMAGTAPFIGLFGTVLGIMHTFSSISQKGFGGPAVVSAGISQALIATAAGLAVAIPALILYNYFVRKANQKVRGVEAEASQILIMLGWM